MPGPATALQPFEVLRSHLYRQIADRIEGLIVARALQAGERLPSERELARMLGVNRATVREGTRILIDRGLIELKPGMGTYVATLTPSVLIEPFERLYTSRLSPYHELEDIRLILEPEIAALAAQHAPSEEITRLEELVKLLDSLEISPEERATADTEFHLALTEATRLKMLVALYLPLISIVRRKILDLNAEYQRRGVHGPHPPHGPILEAVRARDADGARLAMRQHIMQAGDTIRNFLDKEE
jgi:GntR family transcriptional repressor for pyruvate dehydrogenase complex